MLDKLDALDGDCDVGRYSALATGNPPQIDLHSNTDAANGFWAPRTSPCAA